MQVVFQAREYVIRGLRLCAKDPFGLLALAGLFALFDVSSVAFSDQDNIWASWVALVLPWISIIGGNLALIFAVEALAKNELVVPAKILPQTFKWLRRYLEVNGITTIIFWGMFVPLKTLLDYWVTRNGYSDILTWIIILPFAVLVHVRLVFATYAAVVDNQNAIKAVAISWRVAHKRWMLVTLSFLFALVAVSPFALPALVLSMYSPKEIQNGINWTIIQLIRPVLIATLHELYVDYGMNGKLKTKSANGKKIK
ncbi:hypothetical protein KBB41_01985 [Candidatus Curtissbacteria bacterium]|nr:hypothetical protein [Candidatus Curtissbacteria bacterium]